MFEEFTKFAMRGNVVDMAVGVVMGGAFGKIVSSLVADVIMPVVGKLTGGVDFSNKFIVLGDGEFATLDAAKEAGVATLNYGIFIDAGINFLIIAAAIFFAIKVMNRLQGEEEEAPAEPTTKECGECLLEVPIKATRCGYCTIELT
ncbi:MAG: large conductance mechanosensitive channel protein MscL [Acidobacteriota bacterium]